MGRFFRIMVYALALVVGFTFSTYASGVIKIGALYNLTGAMSSIDAPAYNGVKLAAKEVNEKGGVLGKKIEVIGIDTKTNVQDAATAARQLLSEGVVAGIGYGDTAYVLAAAPLFQKKHVPFLTSGATDPKLPEMVGSYLFLVPFGDNVQAYAMADFLYNDLHVRKIVIWTNRATDYTLGLSKYFKQRFEQLAGKKGILLEDFYQTGDKDYSAQIARLKALKTKPDALYISAVPDDIGIIVKQVREAGITIPIAGGDGYDTPLLEKVPGKKYATNIYYTTHQSWSNPDPVVQNFIKNYTKMFGHKPENAFAALGYDALMMVVRAIKNAKSTNPVAIRNALAKTKGYHGVTGVISYKNGSRIPQKSVAIMKVMHGKVIFVKMVMPKM